jgi:hypothetical protein
MRKLLLILGVFTVSLSSCAQSYKEYSFEDIGLQIKIPNGYVIQDTFPRHIFIDANNNLITDSSKLKDMDRDLWKGLLIISSPDHTNTASFNIAKETLKTGNFDDYYAFSKDMQLLITKQQIQDYDSSSSILTSGRIVIQKFLTFSTKTNQSQYSGIYLAKVKEYFLIIKTDYIDKTFGDVVDKIIRESKFD